MRGGNSNDRIAGVGGRCRNPKCALSPAISVLLFDPRHPTAASPHQQGTAALLASFAAVPLCDQPGSHLNQEVSDVWLITPVVSYLIQQCTRNFTTATCTRGKCARTSLSFREQILDITDNTASNWSYNLARGKLSVNKEAVLRSRLRNRDAGSDRWFAGIRRNGGIASNGQRFGLPSLRVSRGPDRSSHWKIRR